jgi:hypothetical protein
MKYSSVGSMKVLAAVAVVALLTVGLAGPAQAQSTGIRVYVPFEFRVGDTVLPPGTYEVWSTGNGGAISISDRTGHSAVILTNGTKNRSVNPAESQLVFNAYGNRYFLGEVRWSGYSTARLLPKSKVEMEMAKNGAAPSTLSLAGK